MTERAFINALHKAESIVGAASARALDSRHDLNLSTALPLDLPTFGMPKVAAFYRHRKRPA